MFTSVGGSTFSGSAAGFEFEEGSLSCSSSDETQLRLDAFLDEELAVWPLLLLLLETDSIFDSDFPCESGLLLYFIAVDPLDGDRDLEGFHARADPLVDLTRIAFSETTKWRSTFYSIWENNIYIL